MSTSSVTGHDPDEPPTKTKLVTVLFAIGGVLSLPVGVTLLGVSSAPVVEGASGMENLVTILAIGTFASGGIALTLAYGLWNVRAWSWYGTVLVTAAGIAVSLWAFLQSGRLPWYTLLVGLAVIWALWDDRGSFGLDHELPV